MSRRNALPALFAIAAAAAALAGCGKLGDLERPGPMFGPGRPVTNSTLPHQDPTRPVQTIDPRDENAVPGSDAPPPPAAPQAGR